MVMRRKQVKEQKERSWGVRRREFRKRKRESEGYNYIARKDKGMQGDGNE